jgi:hypothetical protein
VPEWGLVAALLVTPGGGGGEVLDRFVTLCGGCILAEISKSGTGPLAASGGGKPSSGSVSGET